MLIIVSIKKRKLSSLNDSLVVSSIPKVFCYFIPNSKSFFNKTTRVYILALVKDGEERPTCEVDDNTYYDGDLFETKCNRDLRCICMPGYIGMKQKVTFVPHVLEKN